MRRNLPHGHAPAGFALALTFAVACSAAAPAAVVLRWTAPGDNGMSGTAASYDLRRSTSPITSTNFLLADTVAGLRAPSPAGSAESCAVALPLRGVTYWFALRASDRAGNWSAISNVVPVGSPPAAIATLSPPAARLEPPAPNPARAFARLRLVCPSALPVALDVLDAAGRRVRVLAAGAPRAGTWDETWDLRDDRGRAVASGVYFVRARIGQTVQVRRLAVSR